MKQQIFDKQSPRVILLFAGWGMSPEIFQSLSKPGYDIAVVWDYTDVSFDPGQFGAYDEIVVVAWSMGVYYASMIMERYPLLPYTKKIAVNGTMRPFDGSTGIDPELFLKSAAGVSDGFVRFYRRVCGGASAMASMMPVLPARDPEQMRGELMAIYEYVQTNSLAGTVVWDEVHISGRDMIFPPEAMKNAWRNTATRVIVHDGESHMIDFGRLLSTRIVDKDLVGERFAGASQTYDDNAECQRKVAAHIIGLAKKNLSGDTGTAHILEIGSGAGLLTRMYRPLFGHCDITAWDISGVAPTVEDCCRIHAVACDAETTVMKTLPCRYDVVFSSSTIQWFNSPRTFMTRLPRLLVPGGMAFISCFGPGTFAEFEGSGSFVGLSYPDFTIEFLEQCGFEALIESEEIEVSFRSPQAALRHLQRTGVNAVERRVPSVSETRCLMNRISKPDGTASLHFNARYYILKKIISDG